MQKSNLVHEICQALHTISEVTRIMKDKQEKKDNEKFNSITQKVKPQNQNQHHNVKKEGVDAKRRKV